MERNLRTGQSAPGAVSVGDTFGPGLLPAACLCLVCGQACPLWSPPCLAVLLRHQSSSFQRTGGLMSHVSRPVNGTPTFLQQQPASPSLTFSLSLSTCPPLLPRSSELTECSVFLPVILHDQRGRYLLLYDSDPSFQFYLLLSFCIYILSVYILSHFRYFEGKQIGKNCYELKVQRTDAPPSRSLERIHSGGGFVPGK